MPNEDAPTDRYQLLVAAGSLALMFAIGCGGSAQLVLRGPLSDRCVETGLKGCSEMVDGVVAYVDGDKTDAEEKLKRTSARNAPDKLQEFAATLQPLADLPGAQSYAGLIKEVVDLLAKSAKASERVKQVSSKKAMTDDSARASEVAAERVERLATRAESKGGFVAPPPRHDWSAVSFPRMRTRSVAPFADGKKVDCNGPLAVARGGGGCSRVSVLTGPFVVTDLYAPGGCGDDLFVAVDGLESSGWVIFNTAFQSLNMHGVELVVSSGESLYVGARTEKASLRSEPLRCSVTLSGWGPEEVPHVQSLDADGF
jgi:hypothetical protein